MSLLGTRNIFNETDTVSDDTIYVDNINPYLNTYTEISLASFNSSVNINGVLTLNSNLIVNNSLVIGNDLVVSGTAIIRDDLGVYGDTILYNSLVVLGNTSLLSVRMSDAIASTLTVSGAVSLQSTLNVRGNVVNSGTLTNIGMVSLVSTVNINTSKNLGQLNIGKTLGSNFPLSAEHGAQTVIYNNIGNKSLAIGVLDNGVSFISPKEIGVGWYPLLLNPGGSVVGIGYNSITGLSDTLCVNGTSSTTNLKVTNSATINGAITANSSLTIGTIEALNSTLNIGNNSGTGIVNIACSNTVQSVNIGSNASSGTTTINIGGSGDTVNVAGSLNYIQTTNLEVADSLITLNKGSSGSGTARGSGFQIRDNNNDGQAYIKTSTFGNSYVIKAPENNFELSTPVLNTNALIITNQGQQILNGDLVVNGYASITSTLTVNNDVSFQSSLLVLGNIRGNGNLLLGTTDSGYKINASGTVNANSFFVSGSQISTSNVLEGTNLYYTDTRARNSISGNSNGLLYNSSTGIMTMAISNSTTTGALSSTDWNTFNNKENVLTFSGPLSRVGNSISIPQGNSSTNGFLSSTDWNTFNNKENILSFSGPLSRVGNGISIPQGNSSTNGFLSSTDWNTFNNKENVLTFSGPLSRVGNGISIPQGNSSTNGFLSSTDWNTFNNKVSSQWTTSGTNVFYNSGSVGIGTNNPKTKLHVVGDTIIENGNNATSRIILGPASSNANLDYCSTIESVNNFNSNFGSDLKFSTHNTTSSVSSTERMRITDDGKILMNTTTTPQDTVQYINQGNRFNGLVVESASTTTIPKIRIKSVSSEHTINSHPDFGLLFQNINAPANSLLMSNSSLQYSNGNDTVFTMNHGGSASIGNCRIGTWDTFNTSFFRLQNNALTETTATNYSLAQNSLGRTLLNSAIGQNMEFRIGNATQMILNSSGNVNIGGSNPTEKLQVSNGNFVVSDSDALGFHTGIRSNFASSGYGEIYCYTHSLSSWAPLNINEGGNIWMCRNAGNVGIGTSSATTKLSIRGGGISLGTGFNNNSTRPAISTTVGAYEIRSLSTQFSGGDDGFLRLSAGGGTATTQQSYIDLTGFNTNADMLRNIVLGTSGVERMRINSSGNVGIGTSVPAHKLQVNGSVDTNTDYLINGASLMPLGGIIMWSGATVPTNWSLCDGATYNGRVTPDLRGRFIVGAGITSTVPITSGLIGAYTSNNWNNTSKTWTNSAGGAYGNITGNSLTNVITDSNYGLCVNGGTTASLSFPTVGGVSLLNTANNYTFIYLARYNGANQQRIFDGSGSNWLSGFWQAKKGIAFHGQFITQSTYGLSDNWILGVDQWSLFRANGNILTTNVGTGTFPTNIQVNVGASERSDWAINSMYFFNRELTTAEIQTMESFIQNKIGNNGGEDYGVQTIGEMPIHTHSNSASTTGENWSRKLTGTGAFVYDPLVQCSVNPNCYDYSEGNGTVSVSINNNGGGLPKINRPPYYTLAYIMRTT